MSISSQKRNKEQRDEENSQTKNAVSIISSVYAYFFKEVFEKKEETEQADLQMIDQNQVTLKNDDHGKRANEHHKEEVNSLMTIKNRSSPKDPQTNEVSIKRKIKEHTEEEKR